VTAPARSRRVVPAAPRREARARAARSARRRRLLRHTGNALVVLLPLLALAWVLLASDWLGVDRVEVTGTSRLESAEVVRVAAVQPGTPLARVDTAAVEARIGTLAPVAEVAVRRSWPGTLTVQVRERVPAAGVLRDGGVSLVDATGVVFGTEPALPEGVVRLQVAAPGPADPATRAALDVHAVLPAELRGRVRIVRADSPSAVVLQLEDGREVVWGRPGQSATKAAAVLALLSRPGSVYDVSAGDVVVVK
jgi:cell division protein FtsQ